MRLRDISGASEGEAVRLSSVDGGYESPASPGLRATVQGAPHACTVHLTQADRDAADVHIRRGEQQRWFSWALGRSMVWDVEHELDHGLHGSSPQGREAHLSATLPGRISEVMVQAGQHVVAGAPVLTLEAMKLYHSLTAPVSGVVQRLHAQVGDIVAHGQLLVEFEPEVAAAAA